MSVLILTGVGVAVGAACAGGYHFVANRTTDFDAGPGHRKDEEPTDAPPALTEPRPVEPPVGASPTPAASLSAGEPKRELDDPNVLAAYKLEVAALPVVFASLRKGKSFTAALADPEPLGLVWAIPPALPITWESPTSLRQYKEGYATADIKSHLLVGLRLSYKGVPEFFQPYEFAIGHCDYCQKPCTHLSRNSFVCSTHKDFWSVPLETFKDQWSMFYAGRASILGSDPLTLTSLHLPDLDDSFLDLDATGKSYGPLEAHLRSKLITAPAETLIK